MTRNKSLAINVLAAAATLACIGTASAQENTYNPNAYILLNGSAMKPDSKFPEDKVGYGGGVKIGVPLSPSWDLQIGGNYAATTDHGDNFHQTLAGVGPAVEHHVFHTLAQHGLHVVVHADRVGLVPQAHQDFEQIGLGLLLLGAQGLDVGEALGRRRLAEQIEQEQDLQTDLLNRPVWR